MVTAGASGRAGSGAVRADVRGRSRGRRRFRQRHGRDEAEARARGHRRRAVARSDDPRAARMGERLLPAPRRRSGDRHAAPLPAARSCAAGRADGAVRDNGGRNGRIHEGNPRGADSGTTAPSHEDGRQCLGIRSRRRTSRVAPAAAGADRQGLGRAGRRRRRSRRNPSSGRP